MIWWLAAAVLAATMVLLVSAVRWWYAVITVHGPSMAPTLADGDRVLARRCRSRTLRTGSLVIFSEPGLGSRSAWLTGAAKSLWVVKRVAAVPGEPVPEEVRSAVGGATVVPPRAIVVLGDSPESRDSRYWGFIPASHILGEAIRRL